MTLTAAICKQFDQISVGRGHKCSCLSQDSDNYYTISPAPQSVHHFKLMYLLEVMQAFS